MSRRVQNTELEFGSDSFLDIVANIVGVLIILIVVMGIRVSQQTILTTSTAPEPTISPPDSESIATPLEIASISDPIIELPPEPTGPTLEDVLAREQENSQIRADNAHAQQTFLEARQQHSQIQSQLATLEDFHSRLAQDDAHARQQLHTLSQQTAHLTQSALESSRQSTTQQQQLTKLTTQLTSAQQQLSQKSTQLQQFSEQTQRDQATLETTQQSLAQAQLSQQQLRAQIEEAFSQGQHHLAVLQKINADKPPTKKITHQMTSLGSLVSREEVHFRLQGNRISYVPLMELIDLVKDDLASNKEKLLQQRSHFSSVGPIDGFSLRYKASRQELSIADGLRMGGGVYKIGVDYWELFESGLAAEEPIEAAVRPDSQFIKRMKTYNPAQQSITLWVYPDSYEIYQQLRVPIEKAAFQIAARPLPTGVPIAGSPNGSRSLSQ